jgi:hypothetical protein
MIRKVVMFAIACVALAGCASGKPKIIQASTGLEEVRLTQGMATQIEMPNEGHVQSVVTGNPELVTAERSFNVVNLIPKLPGETNVIVRFVDDGGDVKVFQYRVTIAER